MAIGRTPTAHEVVYDDTPVLLHAADLLDRLEREGGSLAFERVFEGRTRAEMIGLFLALLELIRQQRVRAQQQAVFGTIVLFLLDPTPISKLAEAERPEPDVTDVSGAAESPAAPLEDDLDEEDAEIRAIDESIGEVSVDPPLEPDQTPRNKGDDSSAAEG